MKFLLAAAFLATTSILPITSSFANNELSAKACQPLSKTNLQECCSAENWRIIILPGDTAFCPPLSATDKSGRVGEKLVDAGGDVPVVPVTTGSIPGNPGNANATGQAGEKGMDTETPTTGTQGKSN